MLKVSSRTIVVVDQRLLECSFKKDKFDASELINKYKNLIVLRSLSNFYSIESLKISYVITSELSKVIQEKNMVNQIDKLSERLAITVVKDKKYQSETRNKIKTENEYVSKTLNDSNVKFRE